MHHLVPFQLKCFVQTGATIDTSWGQLMVSPHGVDDMLAQVLSWSEYISTYFTYDFFVNHLYLLNRESHNVLINVPDSKSSTTQHPDLPLSVLPTSDESFASIWSNFFCRAHLDGCESTRPAGPSGFVVLILNLQPNLLLPEHSQ